MAEPPIVPRWEWRTFGGDLSAAEHLLHDVGPGREQASEEVYLVSVGSDASVKLRDEQADVKQLEQVDDRGLELWRPVLKAAFPLSAEQVGLVLTTLRATIPSPARSTYTRELFAADVVAVNPDLLAVPVGKRRMHYLVDDCMVELTDIETASGTVRTIAIESPDPAIVGSTIERLGLVGRANVNMARGLKTLVGFDTRRNAVIDVGTNSVKFHLGERRADGTLCTITDRAEVTRLGEGLDRTGRLSDDAIARTVTAIAGMRDDARASGAGSVAIVGTAGLRRAENRTDFDDALRARSGTTVEILSGEDEGRLAYLAATSALPVARGTLVVFDSGGGSTQFTFGRGHDVIERFSLDVGAVRIAERYALTNAVSRDVVTDALDAIAGAFESLDGRPVPEAIIGIGGTVTNLAAVKHALATYDAEVVHGTVLDLDEIDTQIERYRTRTAEERRAIPGLQPARAEVILGGACIVRTILTKLGRRSLTVSDRGLRHGLFVERFAE